MSSKRAWVRESNFYSWWPVQTRNCDAFSKTPKVSPSDLTSLMRVDMGHGLLNPWVWTTWFSRTLPTEAGAVTPMARLSSLSLGDVKLRMTKNDGKTRVKFLV